MLTSSRNFSRKLITWYNKNKRSLPWRRTTDPYKIWISEVMLQQTTVNAVIPYYERWIKMFPTARHAAKAPLQKILKAWQGLGYYSRAKNIQKAAKIICREHAGKIPRDRDTVRKLPGFGPYTTGAVLSIAFDQRQPIIDANVRRVVMRLLCLNGKAEPSQDNQVEAFLSKVMPDKNAGSFNQGLMELGALICRNGDPLCPACPVRVHCRAHKKGRQDIIPELRPRILKELQVAVGVLQNDGKFFIQKRPSQGLFADLWEFPGGKIEQGETPQEALRREFREELGVDVEILKPLKSVRHFYTQFRVNLHVFLCQSQSNIDVRPTRKWVKLSRLSKYPMPSGSSRIVEGLVKD